MPVLGAAFICVLTLGVRTLLQNTPASAQMGGGTPPTVSEFQSRSLLIMHSDVITDPDRTNNPCDAKASTLKAWGFGALMKGIAGTQDDRTAVAFIRTWLDQFTRTDLQVNGQHVQPRDISVLLKTWGDKNWELSLVPFRLLAIVNRIDLLRSPVLLGENAGEVRFVFGAMTVAKDGTCRPADFTVILEFGVRKQSCASLQDWARNWIALGDPSNPAPSDPRYHASLQMLTDSVTMRDAMPTKPNGSALDHVRTNELMGGGGRWELREFRLLRGTGSQPLVQDTVTLTPMDSLDGTAELEGFLATIARGLQATPPDYWIPPAFPTSNRPLLGATARAGTGWLGHSSVFAKNTCSGCHGGVIGDFTHINPRNNQPSAFLIGDLARREAYLRSVAQNGCLAQPQALRGVPGTPRTGALSH